MKMLIIQNDLFIVGRVSRDWSTSQNILFYKHKQQHMAAKMNQYLLISYTFLWP